MELLLTAAVHRLIGIRPGRLQRLISQGLVTPPPRASDGRFLWRYVDVTGLAASLNQVPPTRRQFLAAVEQQLAGAESDNGR